ncbi:putative secreted protein [Wickerhamomyces ciferrii]|uniref:Secreted protein n=1 Tax=Wickerhamomyces ciferrii (strain ATCC 14091 / BCRC 22168 / CBS 111 / JCM 3599 / NBRC 0793 / NRRL Y-1031 F-60-10) TaxID=1206466 RepID=K0KKR9_WICCF|nr:uncharacterized protein BN7_2291 [Wickerhamomyces ciferrii]CCH42747.1 putative secreted protein [Wickerhamomyces ciferrii]
MWIPVASLLLIVQAVLASSPFIIQLDGSTTFENFLNQAIASVLSTKPDNNNTIEIGDFKAFVADFDEGLLGKLHADPIIKNIFPDVQINVFDSIGPHLRKRSTLEPYTEPNFVKRNNDITTQQDAPRHLARLSQREGIFNETGSLEYNYDGDGSGVTAYVLDTGVAIDNPDFGGRASYGANFNTQEGEGDVNGHGTNVAGIIGSKTYGVAKNVKIVDVKVLGDQPSSPLSGILKGLEWANNDRKKKGIKAVANLSLNSLKNDAFNQAADAAFKDGLVVLTAAGNSAKNTELYSPSSADSPIVVGALDDQTDTIAIYSNWGPRVDIFASGADVKSLSNKYPNGYSEYYGTSQATPVVAGQAAILLQQGTSVGDIKSELIKLSTKNAISQETYDNNSNYTQTVNRVVYNGIENSPDKISNPSHLKQDQSLRKYLE